MQTSWSNMNQPGEKSAMPGSNAGSPVVGNTKLPFLQVSLLLLGFRLWIKAVFTIGIALWKSTYEGKLIMIYTILDWLTSRFSCNTSGRVHTITLPKQSKIVVGSVRSPKLACSKKSASPGSGSASSSWSSLATFPVFLTWRFLTLSSSLEISHLVFPVLTVRHVNICEFKILAWIQNCKCNCVYNKFCL